LVSGSLDCKYTYFSEFLNTHTDRGYTFKFTLYPIGFWQLGLKSTYFSEFSQRRWLHFQIYSLSHWFLAAWITHTVATLSNTLTHTHNPTFRYTQHTHTHGGYTQHTQIAATLSDTLENAIKP
jgi:hypothetical protein